MKILIGTDSRGSHGCGETVQHKDDSEKSWSERIKEIHPEFQFEMRRASMECQSFTIYSLDPWVRQFEDNAFDFAFIQCGFNDGVEYWPSLIFEDMLGQHFNPTSLKHDNNSRFVYRNHDAAKVIFDLLKTKSKRVVYIGFHSLQNFHPSLDHTPTYEENAKEVDRAYSSFATDYIKLPTDTEWIEGNLKSPNSIHYNCNGVQYIVDRIEPYLKPVL